MGGSMVLLSFDSKEEMLGMLEDGKTWLDEFFVWVRPWSPNEISLDHFLWIKIEDVPLHAWCHNFFQRLGNSWGTFISIDGNTMSKSRLDRAKILVLKKKDFTIPCYQDIKVDGELFKIKISVEDHVDCLHIVDKPVQPPTSPSSSFSGSSGEWQENVLVSSPSMTDSSSDESWKNDLVAVDEGGSVLNRDFGFSQEMRHELPLQECEALNSLILPMASPSNNCDNPISPLAITLGPSNLPFQPISVEPICTINPTSSLSPITISSVSSPVSSSNSLNSIRNPSPPSHQARRSSKPIKRLPFLNYSPVVDPSNFSRKGKKKGRSKKSKSPCPELLLEENCPLSIVDFELSNSDIRRRNLFNLNEAMLTIDIGKSLCLVPIADEVNIIKQLMELESNEKKGLSGDS